MTNLSHIPLSYQLEHAHQRTSIMSQLATVQDYIRYAVSCFEAHELSYGQGTVNSYDEAVFLVLRTLNLPPDLLEPVLSSRVLGEEAPLILERIYERCQGKPLAYLLGETYLQGMRFLTDPEVIIPRSPIAEVIVNAAVHLPELMDKEIHYGLDMCTGSGCLAILAACHWGIPMDAVDINPRAIELAEMNIDLHQLWGRVQPHLSNGFEDLQPEAPYDVIICNPPYVCNSSMDALPEEFLQEPDLALRGGDDGMDFIRDFLPACEKFLAQDGLIILEVGNEYEYFVAAFPGLDHACIPTSAGETSVIKITQKDLLRYLDGLES